MYAVSLKIFQSIEKSNDQLNLINAPKSMKKNPNLFERAILTNRINWGSSIPNAHIHVICYVYFINTISFNQKIDSF